MHQLVKDLWLKIFFNCEINFESLECYTKFIQYYISLLLGDAKFPKIQHWHHETTLFIPIPTYGGKSSLKIESLFFIRIEVPSNPKKSEILWIMAYFTIIILNNPESKYVTQLRPSKQDLGPCRPLYKNTLRMGKLNQQLICTCLH